MFRHYLLSAWRNASRDRFYALLNVVGLGLGFAAVILIGLFVRDELSYERFLPGYRDVYRAQLSVGSPPGTLPSTPESLAAQMRLDFPEIATVIRTIDDTVGLRHGEVEANEKITTVDADFFSVLGFPLLSGDPATALAEPDSIVLTRDLALKYFGTIDCLGENLELDHVHSVRVTGIAENPPSNTIAGFTALLSAKSSYGILAKLGRR